MTSFESAISPPRAGLSEQQFLDPDLYSQKMVTLGELASGITHDFRNVLQTVISTLEILESRYNDPAEVQRLTASALRASERGIGLTKRLLKLSRCETTAANPVGLQSSLENVTETLARTVEVRMHIGAEPPQPDLWSVVVDPTEFELALINLGLNARDAMPDGGSIRIAARNVTIPAIDRRVSKQLAKYVGDNRRARQLPLPGGDYVAISVSDTGIGMDERILARAVEPFFTTKPPGQGTGLGLAIVHNLATAALGALRLRSEVGRGTTVELWLPRALE